MKNLCRIRREVEISSNVQNKSHYLTCEIYESGKFCIITLYYYFFIVRSHFDESLKYIDRFYTYHYTYHKSVHFMTES